MVLLAPRVELLAQPIYRRSRGDQVDGELERRVLLRVRWRDDLAPDRLADLLVDDLDFDGSAFDRYRVRCALGLLVGSPLALGFPRLSPRCLLGGQALSPLGSRGLDLSACALRLLRRRSRYGSRCVVVLVVV